MAKLSIYTRLRAGLLAGCLITGCASTSPTSQGSETSPLPSEKLTSGPNATSPSNSADCVSDTEPLPPDAEQTSKTIVLTAPYTFPAPDAQLSCLSLWQIYGEPTMRVDADMPASWKALGAGAFGVVRGQPVDLVELEVRARGTFDETREDGVVIRRSDGSTVIMRLTRPFRANGATSAWLRNKLPDREYVFVFSAQVRPGVYDAAASFGVLSVESGKTTAELREDTPDYPDSSSGKDLDSLIQALGGEKLPA